MCSSDLLMVVFGRNILLLFLAIGAVEWLTMARIMRTQVQSLRQQEFVEAAVSLGLPPSAIIFKHIIPNALGPIIVYTTLTIPSVMLLEAFLSFLGLGIQPPIASWGNMLTNAQELIGTAPLLAVWPGLLILVTVASCNLLGDALQDALDPRRTLGIASEDAVPDTGKATTPKGSTAGEPLHAG